MTRRLLRRLRRGERGFVLPLALGIMVVLAISVTTAIYYTTEGQRSSSYSKGKQLALTLAEAGMNNSMAVLNLPTNNALKQSSLTACTGNAQANWNRTNLDGGYTLWCGDLDLNNSWWSVTAIGFVRSPNNASVIQHKITSRVVVTPVVTQPLNNPAWNYMFASRTGNTCDETLNNNVTGGSRMYVMGNLCLSPNVVMSPSALWVRGNLDLNNNAAIGASTSMATRIETYIGGQCRYGGGTWANPCSGNQDSRHVYSKMNPPSYVVGVNTSVPIFAAPVADFAGWYTNALPGPTQYCTTYTTSPNAPPTFDTLTAGSPPSYIRDNNNPIQNLVPNYSYTCRVGPASNPDGELSWNNTTKTMTVRGTIFIDGSATISNGTLNQYNGQGTIYLSGTLYINGLLCGGVSGSNCDFASWNPNSEMLTFVANGIGPNGSVPSGDSIYLANNSSFQGALYATGNLDYGNNSFSDGPMVGSQIILANNVSTQAFGNISTVPVGMPGNFEVFAQPNPPQRFSG
jgi:Tfp pilus assembly protein PilX